MAQLQDYCSEDLDVDLLRSLVVLLPHMEQLPMFNKLRQLVEPENISLTPAQMERVQNL